MTGRCASKAAARTGGPWCVLVREGRKARGALERIGAAVGGEAIVVHVPGDDRPGIIGRSARTISDTGANVRLACFGPPPRLVFVTGDGARAR